MSEQHSLFGSYGARAILRRFGQPDSGAETAAGKSGQVFGKRPRPPVQSVSLQGARLSHLRNEFEVLFEDEIASGHAPSFVLAESEEQPELRIGDSATVMVDNETGLFVFREEAPHSGLVVVTASDERLLDHVVCHLTASADTTGTETANQAARMLVGETLAGVERRVILQTLRHCHGNRTRASEILGISLRTIRNKLREYWRTSEAKGG